MAHLDDISELDRDEWENRRSRRSWRPNWRQHARWTCATQWWRWRPPVDLIAMTDAEGTFIGFVAEEDIVKLDEILDETGA